MKKHYFSNKQMEAARVLAEELQMEAVTGQTTRQNMVDALKSRYAEVDAEAVVDELCSGLETFHKLYEKAQQQDVDTVIREELDGVLSTLSDEQQRELLAGLMQSFAKLSGEELPELENLELHMMKDTVCAYFAEYGCAGVDLTLMNEVNMCAALEIGRAVDDQKTEEYTALAMYILGRNGELGKVPADMSPKAIGITTAASAEVQRSVIGMILGKIDMEQVKRVLKIVGGVLLIALTAAAAVVGLSVSGLVIVTVVEALIFEYELVNIAVAVLMLVTSLICAGGIGYGAARILSEVSNRSGIAQQAASLVNKLNEYIHNTVVPAAKAFWQMIRSKINELRYGKAEVETAKEPVQETSKEEPAEETEETVETEDAEAEEAEAEDETEEEEEEETEEEEEDDVEMERG